MTAASFSLLALCVGTLTFGHFQRATPPPATASIAGVVVSDADDTPLRLAHVVLIGATTGIVRVTSSDANGRFAFPKLPADRYTVGASKLPYLGAVAGARRPARAGSPIAVSDGEAITDVRIRLPRGSSISGVVTSERGTPAAMTVVSAYQWRTENGERVLADTGAMARTDDRGRYRIHGLTPGEYLVGVTIVGPLAPRALTEAEVDAMLKSAPAPDAETPPERYAPVFYPGTARVSDAQSIVLGAGDERAGIDLRLAIVRTVRVEGVVTTPDGQPAGPVSVSLGTWDAGRQPAGLGFFASATPDGRFMLRGVVPGTYAITANARGALNGHVAQATIEVAGADLTGVQLTLRPPIVLAARIAFDGTGTPPSLAGHRVPLQSLSAGSPPAVAPTDASGAFQVARVTPGRYVLGGPLFFGATAPSVSWTLKSVVVDGRDVTDLPFEVSADAPPKEIVVTYGDAWQEISGRLLQSSGAAAPGYVVVAFPAEPAYWIRDSRRIVTARSGTNGGFTLGGPGPVALPAGDYLLAVVPELDRDEQFDRAFLAALVPAAVRVTLQPGERKMQDLGIK